MHKVMNVSMIGKWLFLTVGATNVDSFVSIANSSTLSLLTASLIDATHATVAHLPFRNTSSLLMVLIV